MASQQIVTDFHFYMHQRWAGPNMNQKNIVPVQPGRFGETIVNDYVITEERDLNSKVLARAQGVHTGAGKSNERWHVSLNIMFESFNYNGSTLVLRGFWEPPFNTMEWAVIGGTKDFRLAQGILIGEKYNEDRNGRDFELTMRVICPSVDIFSLRPSAATRTPE